jgi:enoyl-CoA hydratase/carnithine racemase
MTTSPLVLIEEAGPIATVRLNREEARNALSVALMRALIAAADSLRERSDIHAIIVAGAKTFFSAGADLRDPEREERAARSLVARRRDITIGPRLCRAYEELEQVTIMAIEGYCSGGGVALAAACDFRIAAQSASLRLPEIPLGMNMSWGALPRLTALMGPARAKRFVIFGEALSGAEAHAQGLVDELCPDGGAEAAARVWAEKIAALPPLGVRMTKEAINAAANALHPASAFADRDQFLLAAATADAREGARAFFEKRKPRFSGD